MRQSMAVGWVLVALLAACDSPAAPAGAEFSVVASNVAAADTVVATLVNHASGIVEFQTCSAVLERRVGDGWSAVESDNCNTANPVFVLEYAPGGGQFTFGHRVPPSAVAGTYRLSMKMLSNDEHSYAGTITSNWFQIAAH